MWKKWNFQKENAEVILESKSTFYADIYVKEHILSHNLDSTNFSQSQFAVRLVCLKWRIYSALNSYNDNKII